MQRFINNWTATLTAPAAASAPELSIEPVQAAKLVGLGAGDYYLLTLVKLVDEVEVAWEIVKVTAAASGVLTVERAQEGTNALEWLLGEPVSARFTAEGAEALRSAGGAAVGDATPQSLGTATPGTSPLASRQDHRHALPTPAAIGAATSAQGALATTAVQPAALASGLDGKVDKVAGKGLSEQDFTSELRSKLIAIEPAAFRGVFSSFGALLAGVTSPQPGDFADVDAGVGSDVVRYVWDATDSEWQTGTGGGGPASTDSLPEGATNLYFTVARVLASALTGLSVLAGGPVVSTDSVLAAFGKLQAQINSLTTAVEGKQAQLVSGTNLKSINGNSLLGSGDLSVGGLTNPMTTAGDIIVGGVSGAPARLGAGGAGTMLISQGAGLQPLYGYGPLIGGYYEVSQLMADNNINVAVSNIKKKVISGSTTLTISGTVAGRSSSFTLLLEGGNAHAVTWPASFKWLGGVPTLTAKDVITGFTIDNGTTWIVSCAGSYA